MLKNLLKALRLFKISLKDSFHANRRKGKLRVLFPVFLIFLYLILFIVSFQYATAFCAILQEEQLEYICLLMFYLAAAIVMFMMTAYKARGALFGAKDTEQLLAMPIANSSILIMRILNMMFFNYLIGSLLIIPPTLALQMFGYSINWLNTVIGLLFMPFIPTMLACCIGCVIGVTISKSRHKSIIEAVMTFVFIFVIFGVIANFGTILTNIFELHDDVIEVFQRIYLPVVWLHNAVRYNDILQIVLFAVVNLIFLGLFVLIFNKAFVKINQDMSERYTQVNFKLTASKVHGKLISLLLKELRLYTQSSMHMLNTCFGSVSILIFALSTFFYDKNAILDMFANFGIVVAPQEFVLAICSTMIALSCTTPASISMEGKSLWCLRSMPIKETTIFYSKMLVDLCFIMPANIIAAIILCINFNINIINMFIIIGFMVLVGTCMTHFGLILNLLFPKLKFKAEVEVVKQSMAANLAVYIPLVILAISIVVYMIMKLFISFELFIGIYSAILCFVLIILNVLIRTYGVKKFQTLYC